jgi:hypothetical protein
MNKRIICQLHDEIMKKAQTIERYKERDFDTVEDVLNEVQSLAWDIVGLAETAKVRGQAMEDRLSDYRSTIEGLGFTKIEK